MGDHPTSTAPSPVAVRDEDPLPAGLRRLSAASGVLFTVLVICFTVFGTAKQPKYKASADKFATFARENADTLALGLLLACFAGFALAWFSGVLRGGLQEAEEASGGPSRLADISFAGGLIATSGLLLSSSIRTAAVHEPADAGGPVVRGMMHTAEAAGALIPVGFALLVVPASILALRFAYFPRWLGALGLAAGVLSVAMFFYSLFLGTGPFFVKVLWPITLTGTLIWITAASVLLVRRAGQAGRLGPGTTTRST